MSETRESLFTARCVCAVAGHRWDWQAHIGAVDDAPYRCLRCGHYDDEPGIKRAAARRVWLRRWSPIWPSFSRRDVKLRIGWERPELSVSTRLHFGMARTSELPGLNVTLAVWRLSVWGGIGSGWQDEDGERRSFGGVNVSFSTYGWRWIGCWFGHKPETSRFMPHYVYCARCDESLKGEPESLEVDAA